MLRSPRMVAQQAHFTVALHVLDDQAELIEKQCDQANDDQYFKLTIAEGLKPEFLRHLRAMNVTPTSLFPGMDGLGRSFADLVRLVGAAIRRGVDA
jgi:hypothetical protein